MQLTVNKSRMQRWGTTLSRQRWDYHTHEHKLEDMLNAKYFGPSKDDVQPADLIHIIDKEENEVIVRVDYIDQDLIEVGLSIHQQISNVPVTNTYALRHVGGRGRHSSYQIVDSDGMPVTDPIAGRATAERELDALLHAERAMPEAAA